MILLNKPDIIDAIRSLVPDVAFSVNAGVIVHWPTTTEQPTNEAIQAELARLLGVWDSQAWIRGRSEEYPTTDALIVALWESVVEGRPTDAATLQAAREAVKARHPKPVPP